MTSIGQDLIFASLLFFLLLYPSLGVDVVGAGTGAGALNSALFPPAPPPPNYFRIFDHLASLFSDSHFLLSDPLLLAPFPPLPSRIFAIFTICSLASSSSTIVVSYIALYTGVPYHIFLMKVETLEMNRGMQCIHKCKKLQHDVGHIIVIVG
ncbi:uncharacterized protein EDB91DRAFT_1335418 [Suillus paluster]|uniref:uncharacterized protein n=1 Tax=Suillus paluster TaxID=48578 RepID=UPI001B876692|nr:uncharacterized protein EDB91DRAFT_1335418 [Suillus paluster]KAG1744932.1 hypothetical protein EDB91DRAFT_1335418 [Suillus paluster]